jgi:hypothetical protein
MTTFIRRPDGTYDRGFERHDNVLIDVEGVVRPLLEGEGLRVEIGPSFGTETNMEGLRVIKAWRPA